MYKDRIIYEGWRVSDFIANLEPTLDLIMSGRSYIKCERSKEWIKKWCMDNQPGYKKYIPEVVNYFVNKYVKK